MSKLLQFVEYNPRTSYVVNEERFKYDGSKGWAWLQRVCFWFLRRRQCFAFDEVVTTTRHVIDTEDLVRRIHEQNESLLEHYHRAGERLLIGAETMHELMGDPRIHQFLDFQAEYGHGRSIFGLRISVVPNMRGLVVLPKL